MPEIIWTALIGLASAVIVALISYKGVKDTNKASNQKVFQEIKIQNAVQTEKIENLTREVRKNNEFVERIPRLEQRVEDLEKRFDRFWNDTKA